MLLPKVNSLSSILLPGSLILRSSPNQARTAPHLGVSHFREATNASAKAAHGTRSRLRSVSALQRSVVPSCLLGFKLRTNFCRAPRLLPGCCVAPLRRHTVPSCGAGPAERSARSNSGPQPRAAPVSRDLAGSAQLRALALPESAAAECAGAAFGFPRLQSALRPASPPPALPPPCAMAGCAARVPPGSEARLSLATFLLGASVLALPLLTRAGLQGRTGLALYVAGLNALLLLLYRPPRYQVRAGCGGTGRAGPVDWLTRTRTRHRAGRTGWTGRPGLQTRTRTRVGVDLDQAGSGQSGRSRCGPGRTELGQGGTGALELETDEPGSTGIRDRSDQAGTGPG